MKNALPEWITQEHAEELGRRMIRFLIVGLDIGIRPEDCLHAVELGVTRAAEGLTSEKSHAWYEFHDSMIKSLIYQYREGFMDEMIDSYQRLGRAFLP